MGPGVWLMPRTHAGVQWICVHFSCLKRSRHRIWAFMSIYRARSHITSILIELDKIGDQYHNSPSSSLPAAPLASIIIICTHSRPRYTLETRPALVQGSKDYLPSKNTGRWRSVLLNLAGFMVATLREIYTYPRRCLHVGRNRWRAAWVSVVDYGPVI
ncbi:hypothetical protein HYPSUDRAFT_1074313 [Hypholoma sublateritium FD-334 SS-4]|uniref:Uncharacterized protein n=1 Tax=Hypholoma sublateritium (strain FD-334 SS-4) TaxID=945553 RepID=A0A0D2PZK9_HYPSF|nr:hypothetical protein HYPSUDRAFT_1074313 [Hypholoma sublateritium FD-334 SS-4]